MQVINLSLPFGQIIPGLFCPMCGAIVHNRDTDPSCSHILFTYQDIFKDFMYVKKGFEKFAKKAKKLSNQGNGIAPEELAKMIESESAVCLAVTGSGMACGPVSYTYYVAFDLGDEEDE